MTTPAQSISAYKPHTGTSQIFINGLPYSAATDVSTKIGRLWKERGESVGTPYLVTWHTYYVPTNWFHKGGFRPHQFLCSHSYGSYYYGTTQTTKYTGGAATGKGVSLEGLLAIPPGMEDKLINKLLLEIKDQKVNLSQAFAERQQSIDLLASTVDDIYKTILNFRRQIGKKGWKRLEHLVAVRNRKSSSLSRLGQGLATPIVGSTGRPSRFKGKKKGLWRTNPKGSRRLTDERLTQHWLALQYGIKPGMQDAYGIVSELERADSPNAHAYRGSAKAKTGLMTNQERTDIYHSDRFSPAGLRFIYRTSSFVGVSGTITMEMSCDPLVTLSNLGITNPASIVWELTPFSFVVDWFLPLGDYINAWDATLGWTFLNGSIARVGKLEGQFVGAVNLYPLPYYGRNDYDLATIHTLEKGQSRLFTFTRSVLVDFPGPRIPSFKSPVTVGHFANAMALLVQLFR